MWRFVFLLWVSLHPLCFFGGFWDWFVESSQKNNVSFYCPHHCGEWGSSSIRAIEWDFVQCLYESDTLISYIDENIHNRKKKFHSVQHSENFVPTEYRFTSGPLKDFSHEWYAKLKDKTRGWNVALSDCDVIWRCEGCKTAIWKVNHIDDPNGEHIGKEFLRYCFSENYDYGFQEDEDNEDDDKTPWYNRREGKTVYRFGNFIDFHNTCLQLENDIFLERDADRCRSYRYSPIFWDKIKGKCNKIVSSIQSIKTNYHAAFVDCAKNHGSPFALYNLALHEFTHGKYEDALNFYSAIIDKFNFDNVDKYLASHVFDSKGGIEVEIGLYDQALLSLNKSIHYNPGNRNAYFERAITYFEKGEFDLALSDYLNGVNKSFTANIHPDPYLIDYARGLINGARDGLKESATEFLPNIGYSLMGLGNLIWTVADNPIESAKLFAGAVIDFIELLRSTNASELFENLTPEAYELVTKWSDLTPQKRGNLAGYSLGKYGTDIFLPIAVVKGARYIKAYHEIRRAEKLCILKTLEKSTESRAALESAAKNWNAQRVAWFEKIELEIDKQTKHMPNMWNYEEGKSIWLLSKIETQELLKVNAGKGQKLFGIAGEAGYRERVDFGKTIGYYIDSKTNEKT